MILEAIEARMRSTKSEHLSFAEKLTIEHLLPQSWESHYPFAGEDADADALADRRRLLHSAGNLTLLTKSLNPAVSNGPWHGKKEQILSHSGLALNRMFKDADGWAEAEIRERGLLMLDFVRQVWPAPNEVLSGAMANVARIAAQE